MAKQYVDFNSLEYFDAETSLDDKDIKLKPKNDRALDFVGEITINGTVPGGSQVQADWAQTDSEEVDYIKNKPNLATVEYTGSVAFKVVEGGLQVTFDGTTYYEVTLTEVQAQDQNDGE